jgi:hypothetical protein
MRKAIRVTQEHDKKLERSAYSEQKRGMKLFSTVFAVLYLSCITLFGQTRLDLQSSDTVQSILQKVVGQTVELHMRSGEKIGGKVERLGDRLVHLSQLSGAEYSEAAVQTADISVVVVRTK